MLATNVSLDLPDMKKRLDDAVKAAAGSSALAKSALLVCSDA